MRGLTAVVNFDSDARPALFLIEFLTPDDWWIDFLKFLSDFPLLNVRIRQSRHGAIISFPDLYQRSVVGLHAIGE
jgi:hypothetical protein